jgi:hypothetical protein
VCEAKEAELGLASEALAAARGKGLEDEAGRLGRLVKHMKQDLQVCGGSYTSYYWDDMSMSMR